MIADCRLKKSINNQQSSISNVKDIYLTFKLTPLMIVLGCTTFIGHMWDRNSRDLPDVDGDARAGMR